MNEAIQLVALDQPLGEGSPNACTRRSRARARCSWASSQTASRPVVAGAMATATTTPRPSQNSPHRSPPRPTGSPHPTRLCLRLRGELGDRRPPRHALPRAISSRWTTWRGIMCLTSQREVAPRARRQDRRHRPKPDRDERRRPRRSSGHRLSRRLGPAPGNAPVLLRERLTLERLDRWIPRVPLFPQRAWLASVPASRSAAGQGRPAPRGVVPARAARMRPK